jgi:hypothetical protein
MTTIEDQISKVETKIEEVETEIKVVETKLGGELSEKDKTYYRKEKNQLREKENQLHGKEKQLREEKNLLLARQQPQPNGELRCCLCVLVFQCCFEYGNDSVCSPSAVFLFLLLPKPLSPTMLVFY